MNMKRDLAIIAVLILVVLAGGILFQSYSGSKQALQGVKDMGREEGVVTLALGESAKFGELVISPTEIIEDSRCAIDVICVWAGTVRIKIKTTSGLGTAETPVELGKSMTTEVEEVKFVAVSPSRKESEPTDEKDYRFTFEVRKRPAMDTF